jgi:hypothetical protein
VLKRSLGVSRCAGSECICDRAIWLIVFNVDSCDWLLEPGRL